MVCQVAVQKIFDWGEGRSTRIVTLPPPRRPGELTAAHCTQCRGEIYESEDYFRIDGRAVCTDCLAAFAEDYFGLCRVRGGTGEKE